MLSILIPIYNQSITKLVEHLIRQCHKANLTFEIICLDDGSTTEVKAANRPLNGLFGVNYVELTENIGRAKIRNQLAQLARYPTVLFLDCDVRLPSASFIKRYLPYLRSQEVVIGGITCDKRMPKSKEQQLHWIYGQKRESIPAKKNQKAANYYVHTANVLAPTDIVRRVTFDTSILLYGYEDLVWGTSLTDASIPIRYIDNPVRHKGLVNRDLFVKRLKASSTHLATLYYEQKIKHTRLIDLYNRLQALGLASFGINMIERRKNEWEHALKTTSNKLWMVDLLKLYYFAKAYESILSEALE